MPNEYDDLVASVPSDTIQQQPTPGLSASTIAPAAPKPAGEYDDLVAAHTSASDSVLHASLHTAAQTDADAHAKIVALADKFRLPPQIVAAAPEAYAAKAKWTSQDIERVQKDHPELASWLSNPDNASIAQDDLHVLRTLDHAVHAITNPQADPTGVLPDGFIFGRNGEIVEPDGTGQAQTYADIADLKAELNRRGNAELARGVEHALAVERAVGVDPGFFKRSAYSFASGAASSVDATAKALGIQNADRDQAQASGDEISHDLQPGLWGDLVRAGGGTVGDLPLLLAGGPIGEGAGALAKIAKLGTTATKALEVGAVMQPFALRGGINAAQDHGAAYGAADWLINTAIPGALGAKFGAHGIARLALGSDEAAVSTGLAGVAKRMLQEAGFMASQSAVTEVAGALNDRISGADPNALEPGRLFDRLLRATVVGGAQGAAFGVVPAVGEKFYRDQVAKESAASYGQRLALAVDTLKASKTQERSPERMAGLLGSLGGAERHVYAQASDFDAMAEKAGQQPLDAARAMGIEASYREAKASGGDVQIPVEKFLQAAATIDGAEAFVAKVKQAPGAVTAEEAKAEPKATDIEALHAEVARAATQQNDESTKQVHDDLVHQLVEAGHDPSAAKRQAQIVASAYRTLAERWNAGLKEGETPLTAASLFDRFPLSIERGNNADYVAALAAQHQSGEKSGTVAWNTLAHEGDDQAVFAKPLVDRAGLRPEALRDLLVGVPLGAESNGVLSGPALAAMLAHVRRAALDDPKVLDAIVRSVPVDVVHDLFGSEAAAKKALHDEAVLKNGAAVDAHLPVAETVDAASPIGRLLSVVARGATEHAHGAADSAGPAKEGGSAPIADVGSLAHEGLPGSVPRATISFGKNRAFSIKLFEGKNLSSFLHEGGHAFLEVFGELASSDKAPEGIKRDFQTILDWLGVKDRGEITRPLHEKFARGFESYLMEGKAPSPELRPAFQRVKQWFIDIYRKLSALNVKLSDDVRGVFDRLLATDDEIAAAEHDTPPVFASAEQAGMSDREFAAYRKTVEAAHNEAQAKLEKRLMSEMRAEQSERYKAAFDRASADVAKEVDQRPVYAALNALQDGKLPNGEATTVKLDRADIVARGLDPKALPGPKRGENAGRHVYAREGGVTLDAAAELFGFRSGDELFNALATAPNREKVIRDEAKARLREEGFPDSRTDGSVVEKAQDAVQGEKRGEVIVAELRALRKRAEEVAKVERAKGNDQADARAQAFAAIPPVELLRAAAKEQVRGRAVRDLNPNGYLVAVRKASREAFAASSKGDWTEAAAAKQRELTAHELYRAAMDAKAETDDGLAYLKKIQKPASRERIGKAGGWEWTVATPDGRTALFPSEDAARTAAQRVEGSRFERTSGYLEQIDGILDRFDLKPATGIELRRRESLSDWARAREAEGEQVAIPAALMDESLRRNWKQLTVDKARGVVDAVRNIAKMASDKNKVALAKEQADTAAKAGEIVAQVESSKSLRDTPIGRNVADTPASMWGRMVAGLTKMATLMRQMDGAKDGGVMQRLFVDPLNEAHNAETAMRFKDAAKLKELAKAWGKMGPSATIRKLLPAINANISLEGRIAVALNWGNAGNRERLMSGHGWSEDQVQSILATLDAKDWAFVQGVWDHIDSYWSEIAAKQQRVTGVAPEKIDAIPVETRFGTMRGGYYPAAYDPRTSAKAHGQQVEEQAKLVMRGAYTAATTRRGFTEARSAEGLGKPLRLDLGVIGEHLSAVTHDLSFHEPLIAITKLLRKSDVQDAIVSRHGMEVWKSIQSAITDTAAGEVHAQTMIEKGASWLRQGSNIAAMAWNLQVAAMNLDGVFHTIARLGPKYAAKGLMRLMRTDDGWLKAARFINESSPYMRSRGTLGVKSAGDVLRQGLSVRKPLAPVEHSFHAFTIAADQAVAMPTWLGAYEQASDRGLAHDEAVLHADKTVRESQGSGAAHDLADIQRGGPLRKLFTQFYHYASVKLNLTMESASRMRQGGFSAPSVGGFIRDLGLLYVGPALWATAVRAAFGKLKQDEPFSEEAAKEIGGLALGTLPFARDISAQVFNGLDFKGPAGTRGLEAIADLAQQLHKEVSSDSANHLGKSAINAAGVLLHLPSGQAVRTIDGITALMDGDTANPLAVVSGKPPK